MPRSKEPRIPRQANRAMSIGFRQPDPPPPVDEQVYWCLSKCDTKGRERIAEARVRFLDGTGLELRVLVCGELAYSQLFRDGDDLKLLGHLSERCRRDFQELGWRFVDSVSPPNPGSS